MNEEDKDSVLLKIADSVRLTHKVICESHLNQKSSAYAWLLFDNYFQNIMFMYDVDIFQKCIELSLDMYMGDKGMSVVEMRHPLGWLYQKDTHASLPVEKECEMLH